MVIALVNSPMQTASSIGCAKQDSAEQDTINDVLDDLDSKKDLIDSIHNKGRSLILIIEDIDMTIFFPCIVILEQCI